MAELILAIVVPWLLGHFGSSMVVGALLKVGIPQAVATKIVEAVFGLIKQITSRELTAHEKELVSSHLERVFRDPFDSRN